jgi:hypothetical protein
MPQENTTTLNLGTRNWYTQSYIASTVCPWCSTVFTKRSPRQKFCTIKCQRKESQSRRPKRIYGTPEYYKRKALLNNGFKKCKDCRGVFPIENFWKLGKAISARCKMCAAKRQRNIRKPDENTEGKRKRSKLWRERHPEVYKQRIKDWNKRNPESGAAIVHRRRMLQTKNGIFRVTANDLRRLFIRQDGCCYLCSKPIVGKRELDHITPVKLGGRHAIGNLAWTHPRCNRYKHAKLLVEVRYGKR